MQLISQSAEDTRAIAARFVAHMESLLLGRTKALVVALRGDLGSGKTTFTQGLAHALGVAQTPKSPTFLLAKEYPIPNAGRSLWHLDCYRLNGHQDLITLDLHSIFSDPNNIIVIEWPERIGDGLPKDHVDINFEHNGNDKRSITLPTLP